jgi:hypothetical protein
MKKVAGDVPPSAEDSPSCFATIEFTIDAH